jgi:phage gp36-like protein
MPYVDQTALLGKLPLQHLVDATDDDKDRQPDESVITTICEDASDAVDSFLEGRYTVPLTPEMFGNGVLPRIVTQAALFFALRDIYGRRGMFGEQFPYRDQLEECVKELQRIREDQTTLPDYTEDSSSPGVAITEDSQIDGRLG